MAPPEKKRALLLVHRIPFPPDKGDKIRSWHLFNYLRERYRLSCGFFVDDPDDHQHIEYMQSLLTGEGEVMAITLDPRRAKLRSLTALGRGRPLGFDYYRDDEMRCWVEGELAAQPAIAFGFSSTMLPYLHRARCPVIADLVDADSAKFRQYAETARFPMSLVYAREGRLLADAEADITQWVSRAFLVSEEESRVIAGHPKADEQRIGAYGLGVDTGYFDPAGDFEPLDWRPDLIFTGAMDYAANVDGISHFVANDWPALKAQYPDLTLAIVGARPTPAVTALAGEPGITVTGRVADMRPWLAAARIAIAPLRVARGVQNKVLEAMAMARPTVVSPRAATGINAEADTHLIVAPAGGFRRAVSRLLDDALGAQALGARARDHVAETYGWEAQMAILGRYLDTLGV